MRIIILLLSLSASSTSRPAAADLPVRRQGSSGARAASVRPAASVLAAGDAHLRPSLDPSRPREIDEFARPPARPSPPSIPSERGDLGRPSARRPAASAASSPSRRNRERLVWTVKSLVLVGIKGFVGGCGIDLPDLQDACSFFLFLACTNLGAHLKFKNSICYQKSVDRNWERLVWAVTCSVLIGRNSFVELGASCVDSCVLGADWKKRLCGTGSVLCGVACSVLIGRNGFVVLPGRTDL
uniref:Uncharacterized protein n=1 Tax=Leersia perrieri TaxID=77586 RepID=A0A0D9VV19_9ORYZ